MYNNNTRQPKHSAWHLLTNDLSELFLFTLLAWSYAHSMQGGTKMQQGHCGQWNTDKGRLSCCHSSVLLALQRWLLDWPRTLQPWEVWDCADIYTHACGWHPIYSSTHGHVQYSLDRSICGEIVDRIHLIHIQTDSHTYTHARKLHGTILIPFSAAGSASPKSPPFILVPSSHLEVDLESALACDWQLWRPRWRSLKCWASSELWWHQRLRWLSVHVSIDLLH